MEPAMDTNDWISGRVTLRIGEQPVDLDMTVPARPVKLYKMLPVFQQLTDLFVDASTQVAAVDGRSVSCKAGCGACCSQGVPISEAEVQQIADLVKAMPEPRRSEIRARFAAGVARIRAIGWFDAMDGTVGALRSASPEEVKPRLNELALQYFHQGVPCPFLEQQSCSIHPDRPLACREYLVSTPAEHCGALASGTVRKIEMALKPSRLLRKISQQGRFGPNRFLSLIQALELAENHPEEPAEKTGPEWMADFFQELQPRQE
jgi:Fe-S-cluster containining protein